MGQNLLSQQINEDINLVFFGTGDRPNEAPKTCEYLLKNEYNYSDIKDILKNDIDFVDTTISGFGRGAGNLKTEQLMTHLHKDKTEYITKITPIIIIYLLKTVVDSHILCCCNSFFIKNV